MEKVDGNIITSRGPGTALEFSLKIVEVLLGPEARRSVAAPMVVHEAVLWSQCNGSYSTSNTNFGV